MAGLRDRHPAAASPQPSPSLPRSAPSWGAEAGLASTGSWASRFTTRLGAFAGAGANGNARTGTSSRREALGMSDPELDYALGRALGEMFNQGPGWDA